MDRVAPESHTALMVSTTLTYKASITRKVGVIFMSKTDYSIIGKQYGYWTVLEKDESYHSPKHTKWICRCECGTVKSIYRSSLLNGSSRSCGCHSSDYEKGLNKKHGLSKSRIYHEWLLMRNRCKSNSKVASHYYDRGIKVCDEWNNDFMSFYNWSINNGYNDTLSIDRIDNNGIYEPTNCRWINLESQQSNKTNNIYVIYNDQKWCLRTLCTHLNFPYKTAYKRYTKMVNRNQVINVDELIAPIQEKYISKRYRKVK